MEEAKEVKVITAKEAYQQTFDYLCQNLDKKYIRFALDKVERAILVGKGETSVQIDEMFDKNANLSDIGKIARQLDVYFKALGYRTEVSYGASMVKLAWI